MTSAIVSCQRLEANEDDQQSVAGARVLLVGPLPPPPLTGGVETGVALLLGTSLARTAPITLFNTVRKEDPKRAAYRKITFQVGMCARFVATVLLQRPMIVHVKTSSGTNFYQNALYVVIARALRRRVILQLHSGHFPLFYGRSGRLGRAIIRTTLRLPHCLMALSPGWARILTDTCGRTGIAIVPNVVDSDAFAHAKPSRDRFGIPLNRVVALFIGTRDRELDRQKGLAQLSTAVADVRRRHPELLLVLAGQACESIDFSAELGPRGEGWLTVGVVSDEAKPQLYRSADLFVLPSLAENMPNTLLEAMAAGLPVIATRVGAVPEVVEDGKSGLLVPIAEVTGLAAALQRLTSDGGLRRKLGARGFEIVRRKYGLPVLERRLAEEYAELAGRLHISHAAHARARIVWYRRVAVQRRLRLVSRLLSMSPAEVAHRIDRLVQKQRSRRRPTVMAAPRDPVSARILLGSGPLADGTSAYLLERASVHGFFDPHERDRLAALAKSHLQSEVTRTVAGADAILADGVQLLGRWFRPADRGFDWLADPQRGRLWPLAPLDDADAVRRVGADVKFVWEVNRHQFWATLARAWVYTKNDKYAAAVVSMMRRWVVANPPGLGVNWASNLEVAVRAFSWMWTLQFLVGAASLGDDDLRVWLASLRQHRDFLVSHLSTYTDPTNHLIGEAAALAALTLWLPEWENSDALRHIALATLARELERQVCADGVDREQSTSYQRFVLDLVLQVITLADRNGVRLPDMIRSRAGVMLDAIRALARPGERIPRIGDSDDARGLPFFTADPWDFAEIVATGTAVIGRESASPASYESTLWFSGQIFANAPNNGSDLTSCLLRDGGYAILRSAEGRLIFDCGPLGYLPHASHGHADILSVLVDVAGEELLTDPGTFAYWDEHGRRNLFRSTAMHNTVEVDGYDQADAFDRFKWLNLPVTGLSAVRIGEEFDYVEAWHDGYRRLRPALRHRRGVLRLAGGWLIIDWLEGAGMHRLVRHFHLAPGAHVERCDDSGVRLHTCSGRGALLLRDLSQPRPVIECGLAPYSEHYASLASASVIRLVDTSELPVIRLTLLASESRLTSSHLAADQVAAPGTGGISVALRAADGSRVEVAVRATGVDIEWRAAANAPSVKFHSPSHAN